MCHFVFGLLRWTRCGCFCKIGVFQTLLVSDQWIMHNALRPSYVTVCVILVWQTEVVKNRRSHESILVIFYLNNFVHYGYFYLFYQTSIKMEMGEIWHLDITKEVSCGAWGMVLQINFGETNSQCDQNERQKRILQVKINWDWHGWSSGLFDHFILPHCAWKSTATPLIKEKWTLLSDIFRSFACFPTIKKK